jgi:nicotinamidase/pyrazinamidase
MRKILIVIDMQKDFIDGSLGTPEAQAIVPSVVRKIRMYPSENVFATRDSHPADYLKTQEGRYLPVRHCIRGTEGWQIQPEIAALIPEEHIFDKPTFGSVRLAEAMKQMSQSEELEIELVGLCTDICVISNALLLKAVLPETKISVDPRCCAGVTPEKHRAALETMRSCQIQEKGDS